MPKERKCIFCGKLYQYCPTCKEFQNYPGWMTEFDSEKCHDLYTAIGGLGIGIKTKDDVKVVLDKYNITDYSEFSIGLQRKLNELFPKKTIQKSVEIESNNMNEDISDMEQTEKIYTPHRSRRNYKKNDYENEANTEE